ncbi:MAG: PAS domain S-box protein, partial [Ignavibacteriaceae bacterium]|nr:PAS domain S-box protein [Ignavibacteriaceae bacterium]
MAGIKQTKAELLFEIEQLKKQIAKLTNEDKNSLSFDNNESIQSEPDYHRIFNEVHDPILVFEPEDEIILDVNEQATQVYGYKRSELIGMSLKKISKFVPRGEENIRKTLQKGTYKHFETTHISKEGREIHLEINASVLKYMGQTAILSINRDITERKKADFAIRESERKLSTILDNIPGMAYRCLMDKFWTMKFISKGCKEITGYSQLELLNNKELSYENLIYPEDREIVRREVFKTLDTHKQFELEYRIIRKDGLIRWVWERGVQINEKMDGIPLLEGIIEDITARRQIELAQLESEEKFSKLFNSSPSPMIISEIDSGKVVDINKSFEKLILYSKQEIIGKNVFDLNLWANIEDRGKYIKKIKGDKSVSNYEIKIRTKSGEIRDSLISGEIIVIQDKSYLLTSGIDITKRKQVEKALRQSEERFILLFEQSPIPQELFDANAYQLKVNSAWKKLWNTEPPPPGTYNALLDPQIEALGIKEELAKSFKGKKIVLDEVWFDPAKSGLQGKKRCLRTSSHAIKNIDGKILNVVVYNEDITERKQAEEALRRNEEKLRNIIEHTTNLFYSHTSEHILTYVSPQSKTF